MIKIAHISDLHFSNWDWNPSQFFSKRWLGNLNFLFERRRSFSHERLKALPAVFKNQGITHVIITGDLTTTSSLGEFEKARAFTQSLEAVGLKVFAIPGNHDQYTKSAYRDQLFYDYFPSKWEMHELKEEGMTAQKLDQTWWLVGLDTALATPWFRSSGHFSEKGESHLRKFLMSLPPNQQVILLNHFPFFPHEPIRKRLERGEALKELLTQFPNVKLYCHGHTHRHCLADLRPSHLPLILNSGCTPHKDIGFWHRLDLLGEKLSAHIFSWKEGQWQPVRTESYDLTLHTTEAL